MLPGVGFGEILILVIVALVVVGPRELPRLMREISGITRKLRGLASEFRESFDEMGRQAELDELRKEINALKRLEPLDDIRRDLSSVDEAVNEPLPKSKP